MRIETNSELTVADLRALLTDLDGTEAVTFGKTLKSAIKGECWCGCGGATGGKFVPGHDSKFHGLAKKVARGQEAMPESFACDDAEADFLKWHDREVPVWEAKEALRIATEAAKPAKATKAKATITKVEPIAEPTATVTSTERLDPDSAEYRALLAEVQMGK